MRALALTLTLALLLLATTAHAEVLTATSGGIFAVDDTEGDYSIALYGNDFFIDAQASASIGAAS
jgi:hypothetical protein